jgi:hypothetical protein
MPAIPLYADVHQHPEVPCVWCGNRTSYPRELAEHALAHVIGDKAEQAYRRDDALERRRPMMEAWAAFCQARPAGKVILLPSRANAAWRADHA